MIEIQDGGAKWRPISAIVKNPELRNFFGLSPLEPFCPHTLSLKMRFYSLLKLSQL